jgi:hypothetical protein
MVEIQAALESPNIMTVEQEGGLLLRTLRKWADEDFVKFLNRHDFNTIMNDCFAANALFKRVDQIIHKEYRSRLLSQQISKQEAEGTRAALQAQLAMINDVLKPAEGETQETPADQDSYNFLSPEYNSHGDGPCREAGTSGH